ncbi:MAG: hypothetical protein KGI51_03585 [Rhodospirillales bacterium]|nr:hypothetical protein [Rhodospirillales bacterium]
MNGRIFHGIDRPPRAEAASLPPSVAVAGLVLRFNTHPLPETIRPAAPGHAARLEALRAALERACGDYARPRREFVASYLALVAALIDRHRAALAAALERFAGLYAPEDWLWSAPRPLPRAWLPGPAGPVFAEIAFRLDDGPLALVLADRAPEAALRSAGLRYRVLDRAALTDPAALEAVLGDVLDRFWDAEILPRTPFRRPIPDPPIRPPDAAPPDRQTSAPGPA